MTSPRAVLDEDSVAIVGRSWSEDDTRVLLPLIHCRADQLHITTACKSKTASPTYAHTYWLFAIIRTLPCFTARHFETHTKYLAPQWGAADAEIKVPSGENTELKRSPFKAWSRSVYSHTCYAYC